MFNSVKDVLKFCEENLIRMIDFKMIDLDGRWRHITIPVERFNEDTMKFGIGFDASNYSYAPVEKSDMVFIPELSTAMVDPFCEVPTLSMLGDAMIIDKEANRPFDQYPRNVLKAANEFMKATGIADSMLIGPEFEFYLFDNMWYGLKPIAHIMKSTLSRPFGTVTRILTARAIRFTPRRAIIFPSLPIYRRISEAVCDAFS